MVGEIARHAGLALTLTAQGDLQIDEHHTVEDCALALAKALTRALGDRRGISRYGFVLPMDESLAQVVIDLSGRSVCVFEGHFKRESLGGLPTETDSFYGVQFHPERSAVVGAMILKNFAYGMDLSCNSFQPLA